MTVSARYRPGAVRTPFVDREDVLSAFSEELAQLGERPRLIELTGVGGIGKSRLLHELRQRVPAGVVSASLNLQEPSQRSPVAALATLRAQFGAAGVRFDRFDIAYAVWWQRLNPLVPLTVARIPWMAESEVLGEILDEVAGVPIFGNAVKVIEVAARRFKRWNTIRHDNTLSELDDLSLDELGDAVTFLFASELDAHSGGYLLCVDAYEALVGGVSRDGAVALVDGWLRDLLGQLDRGIVAVATREPLGWARRDARWAPRIRTLAVAALPFQARLELLRAMGVSDRAVGDAIARDCDGVPYFLHLAHESGSTASTYSRVEERFLHHVAPDLVRMLELLSVTRVFDREVFRQVARHYELRADTQTWETLVAYSFIAAADADTLQMHQLMARAIQSRLTPGVLTELHELLRDIWRGRAEPAFSAPAWRESAFHAVSAGSASDAELLRYADRLAAAGKPGLDAMRADLIAVAGADSTVDSDDSTVDTDDNAVASGARPGRLVRLLTAEAALLVGDPHGAQTALGEVAPMLPAGADEVDARTALAAANAHRIVGNTALALSRYANIWPDYAGPARLDAGLWQADLDMAQGRFVDAIAIADAVAADCGDDRPELLGDLARLLCLAHRFAFDPTSAAAYAATARAAYAVAGHLVGLANIRTNEAEVLALTDPVAAVPVALDAINTQRQLGADHEVGKALTALALARLGLGDLDAAGAALDEAVEVLDLCGYRSGRARAELVRALWQARARRHDEAEACVRWAVAEFEATQVYPTMVLVAGELLDRIGRPTPAVSAAVAVAERAIQPLGTLTQLRSAIAEVVSRLVADDWDQVYAQAQRDGTSVAGFYHDNVRVGADLVRMAIPHADQMDLRIWPESAVLAAVNRHLDCVPRLRSVSHNPSYQIHEWVDGVLLNDIAPRGVRLPAGGVEQLAAFFRALGQVPLGELPTTPAHWPVDGDCAGFAQQLLAVTRTVRSLFADQFTPLWNSLGIPADPFEALTLDRLSARPFRLIHSDVHRQNIIIKRGGAYLIVDWELALAGDPVYEIAVHLHKMGYQPDEDAAMRIEWAQACADPQWMQWSSDLDRYLAHERVKSTIVDSVRYAKAVAVDASQLAARTASLTQKLTLARQVWEDPRPVDPNELAALLTTNSG